MNTSTSVLVVDDSGTMRSIISKALTNLGFSEVDFAADGQAALDLLGDKRYDLILSDWEMSPVSGEDFLKRLKQDSRLSSIPIILITGTSSRGASWLAGASAYLSKPFSQSDLNSAITTALRKF